MMIVLVFCLKNNINEDGRGTKALQLGFAPPLFSLTTLLDSEAGLGDGEGRPLFRKHLVCACWQRSKILRNFIFKMLGIVWE